MLSTQATPSRTATDALASPSDAISGARSLPNHSLTRSPTSSISTSLMRSTSEPFRETHKRASRASRSRSQSPSRSKLRLQLPRSSEVIDANATFVSSPALSTTSSYTNDKSVTSQSGRSDKSARRKSASSEQSESYVRTRDRVSQAVGLVLGTASSVTRDALVAGVDLLQFAPIPALGIAGSILVSIWQAIETIESNDIHCLRLAERCADTLLAVHHLAEPDVALELAEPVHKLQEVFADIQSFLEKQSQRPFLHRYLKREEVRRSVGHCEASLGDALGLFMIKIQLHTLRAVKGVRDRRRSQAYSIATSDSSSAYTVSALLGPESSTSTYTSPNQEQGHPRDAGYETPLTRSALESSRTIMETLNASDPLDVLERQLAESGASALKRLSDIMSDLSVSSWTVTECGTEEAYMEDEDDEEEEGPFQPPPGRASHIEPWDSPMSFESSLYDSSCESSLASSPACSPVDLPWPHTDATGNDKVPIAPDRSDSNTPPLVQLEDTRALAFADPGAIEQSQETDLLDNIPSPIWPSLVPEPQEQNTVLLTFRSRCMA
ncbi:hypothetical protein PENSPDRAFT_30738 [Peniophora sp. CONT]|nr:hypothetical protein PENSPDRAFT_30738 [Peniophora sp. CONT]